MTAERVKVLKSLPHIIQRSPEWYDLRRNKITASSAASLLVKTEELCRPFIETIHPDEKFKVDQKCANPYSSRNEFILEKCGYGQGFKGNVATQWGQRYEPIAAKYYEEMTNKKINEFGLIPHDSIDFLAASPDGITDDGIMVEIKCPYVRAVDKGIPFYYWIQVQLQLEVCDLQHCDYLECKIIEYDFEHCLDEYQDDEIDPVYEKKGVLGRNEHGFIHYTDATDINDIRAFLSEHQAQPIVYKIVKHNLLRIERNKQWFELCKPQLEDAWNEIKKVRQEAKNGNFDTLLKLKRNQRAPPRVLDVTTAVCKIPDDM